MTYGTRVSCRFGAPSMPGPAPERPAAVRLTEAETGRLMAAMAMAEGQAARAFAPPASKPPRRGRPVPDRLLAVLAAHGPCVRRTLRDHTGLNGSTVGAALSALEAAGLVRLTLEARRNAKAVLVVTLTPAGRAQAEGTP